MQILGPPPTAPRNASCTIDLLAFSAATGAVAPGPGSGPAPARNYDHATAKQGQAREEHFRHRRAPCTATQYETIKWLFHSGCSAIEMNLSFTLVCVSESVIFDVPVARKACSWAGTSSPRPRLPNPIRCYRKENPCPPVCRKRKNAK